MSADSNHSLSGDSKTASLNSSRLSPNPPVQNYSGLKEELADLSALLEPELPQNWPFTQKVHFSEHLSSYLSQRNFTPYDYKEKFEELLRKISSRTDISSEESEILSAFIKDHLSRESQLEASLKITEDDKADLELQFEQMMLDYERMFAALATPACLWRKNGTIWRANAAFAKLINVPVVELRYRPSQDPQNAHNIFDYFTVESLIDYWNKYSSIALDSTQKAVLSSCTLRASGIGDDEKKLPRGGFSFTVRRDLKYKLPLGIIGNFLPFD